MSAHRPPRRHRPAPLPAAQSETPSTATPGDSSAPLLRVAGLPAVTALFRQAPERVVRLFYEERRAPDIGVCCATLAERRRPYRMVPPDELVRIAGTVLHGGVVAVAEPPAERWLNPEDARKLAAAQQPLMMLDGVGNPHNVGAIARTLAFFGFRHLVLSDHPQQAGLSDAAYRIAEGGLDYLTVWRAHRLPSLLPQCKPLYRVVGTALGHQRSQPLERLHGEQRPVALLLGNEETGLSTASLAVCDLVVSLAGTGAVQSLNVSAATAILAYALRPARRPPGGKDYSRPAGKGRQRRPAP